MKIKRIEPIAVRLPMAKPMRMAGVLIESADNLLVRVESDDGVVGWGEASSAPTMTGETMQGMLAAARHVAPALIGVDACDFGAACARMDARIYGNTGAKAAIEIALHDLAGRAAGKPVYELLGGRKRERFAALWLLGTGSEQGDIDEARAKKAAGFVAFKVKVGTGTAADDARRTRRVCEALGCGMLLCADANKGYDVKQAVEYVRAVAESPLDFFEQPVGADDIAGMAEVARASRVPICVDEGLHSIGDVQRYHTAGIAGGSLKTIKLGGIEGTMRAARLAESLGWKVNLACKVAESSIAAAAMLHIAAAVPSLDWGLSLSNQYLSADLVTAPVRVVEGHVELPRGAGLGVEVDEREVAKYAVKIQPGASSTHL